MPVDITDPAMRSVRPQPAFSTTPSWWQPLELGVEVIAAPYQGPAIESFWWRALP